MRDWRITASLLCSADIRRGSNQEDGQPFVPALYSWFWNSWNSWNSKNGCGDEGRGGVGEEGEEGGGDKDGAVVEEEEQDDDDDVNFPPPWASESACVLLRMERYA
jgi:hypothetical protein